MTPQHSQTTLNNSDKIDTLARIVCMRCDELLHELGIRLLKSGNKYIGCCPIHGGNNSSALNLYPEGHTVPGFWKCRTHHCEQHFKKTIIGFTRGVLSHNNLNWSKNGNEMISFEDTIKWLCNFIKQDINDIKVDKNEIERRKFAAQVSNFQKERARIAGIPKSIVRETLQIPAEYYIKRKYSPEILTKYDIGLCDKQGKEMSGRVVVPIYDEHNLMIGCTGRSVYDKCTKCGAYHTNACPAESKKWLYSKWHNAGNFNTGSCLYNYWNAKKYIKETGLVILVEGPGDIWRLEEAGIHNAVALFGCELTDEQQILLESSGAMSIMILLDNDDAGKEAILEIKQRLNKFYNIFVPEIKTKDIGEMTIESIHEDLLPSIMSIQLKNKAYIF